MIGEMKDARVRSFTRARRDGRSRAREREHPSSIGEAWVLGSRVPRVARRDGAWTRDAMRFGARGDVDACDRVPRESRARARRGGDVERRGDVDDGADHRGRLPGQGLRALRAGRTRASLGRRSDARDLNEKTDVPV